MSSDYIARSIAKRVRAIPTLSVPMTDANEEVAPIPDGQKEFLCIMDHTATDKSSIPEEFDGMKEWADYLTPTQNQEECGSCWAFASSTCLADRFNIIAKKKIMATVSTNFSLLCAFNDNLVLEDVIKTQNYKSSQEVVNRLNKLNAAQFQCGGNYLLSAWCALYANGTTTDDCLPYKLVNPFILQYELLDFGFNGRTAFLGTTSSAKVKQDNFFFLLDKNNATWSCSRIVGDNKELCWDNTIVNNQMFSFPLVRYYCGLIYKIHDDNDLDRALRYDLVKFGPLSTVMNLFDNFYAFDPVNDGVYAPRDDPKNANGGHAVEIVGFGTHNNIPFWWIRNSWGADWGINGCFRMERGNKSCDVEAQVITGIPYFFFSPDQYDEFLDIFSQKNPIKIKEPYIHCLKNPWLKKFFAIYYTPIRLDLYNPDARLSYFRVLAEHPGQKAVFYPEYGITTKIMSVFPGVVSRPVPDPEALLEWFRSSSPHSLSRYFMSLRAKDMSFWLTVAWIVLVVVLCAIVAYRLYDRYRRRGMPVIPIRSELAG